MKNGKRRRVFWVVAWLAVLGVFIAGTFSGYEVVRIWRLTKAAKAVLPGDPDAHARFTPMLGDYNPEIRSEAAHALGMAGPAAKAATPELLAALKDPSTGVRCHAAWALGRIDAGAPAIAALIEALDDDEAEVRRYAAWALMLHGPLAEPAVPKLIERLQNEGDGGYMAAQALGEIGPPAKAAIPHLLAALRKETSLARMSYAQALGKMGPDAKEAVHDLLPMRLDPNPDVRKIASDALKNIDPNIK